MFDDRPLIVRLFPIALCIFICVMAFRVRSQKIDSGIDEIPKITNVYFVNDDARTLSDQTCVEIIKTGKNLEKITHIKACVLTVKLNPETDPYMFAENIAAQWSLNRDKNGNLLLLYDAASQRTGSYVSDALKPFLSDEPLTDWDSSVATNDGQGIDKNCVSAYRTITDSLCEQYYKAGSALREAVDSQALKHTRLPKNRKEGLLATICNGIAFLLFTAISTYAVAFLIPAAASLILFPFAVLLALLQIIRCVVVYPFSRSSKKDLPAVEGTATDRLSVRICTIVAMYHSLYTGIVSQMYPW